MARAAKNMIFDKVFRPKNLEKFGGAPSEGTCKGLLLNPKVTLSNPPCRGPCVVCYHIKHCKSSDGVLSTRKDHGSQHSMSLAESLI